MDSNEYIKTFHIDGKDIKLGLNDYGQCYFVEWEDDEGKIQDVGLGTYNFDYMEEVYYMFDPVYKELMRKSVRGKLTDEEEIKFEEYQKMFAKEYGTYYGEEN